MGVNAMSGICYADDGQLEDERWMKAGIDRENPRIEITVSPLEEIAA